MLLAKDVAEFLKTHPDFMTKHPDVFVDLEVPHPDAGDMIPLSLRQIETLREYNHQLKSDYQVLHDNVMHNIQMLKIMQEFCIRLLGTPDDDKPIKLVLKTLRACYPNLDPKIRIWGLRHSKEIIYHTRDLSLPAYARTLEKPLCGSNPLIHKWYRKRPASIVVLPLRAKNKVFGLLSFGSDDPKTFEAGSDDTELLDVLGQSISAFLGKWL
ncbi:MAG: DUF484 family protein [Alcaligenaceae bacterium]|nr:DUF484 family protein [Alcaligenaceae bacterium]